MNNFEIVVSPTDPESAKEEFAAFLRENQTFAEKLGDKDVIRDEIVSDGGSIKHQYRVRSVVLEQVHQ